MTTAELNVPEGLLPDLGFADRCKNLVSALQKVAQQELPTCTLIPIGSYIQGTSLKGATLDIAVVEASPHSEPHARQRLAELLTSKAQLGRGVSFVYAAPRAEDDFGQHPLRLIASGSREGRRGQTMGFALLVGDATSGESDLRIQRLLDSNLQAKNFVLIAKHWVRGQRCLLEEVRGSFRWTLLIISFLQHHYYLPFPQDLQQRAPFHPEVCGSWQRLLVVFASWVLRELQADQLSRHLVLHEARLGNAGMQGLQQGKLEAAMALQQLIDNGGDWTGRQFGPSQSSSLPAEQPIARAGSSPPGLIRPRTSRSVRRGAGEPALETILEAGASSPASLLTTPPRARSVEVVFGHAAGPYDAWTPAYLKDMRVPPFPVVTPQSSGASAAAAVQDVDSGSSGEDIDAEVPRSVVDSVLEESAMASRSSAAAAAAPASSFRQRQLEPAYVSTPAPMASNMQWLVPPQQQVSRATAAAVPAAQRLGRRPLKGLTWVVDRQTWIASGYYGGVAIESVALTARDPRGLQPDNWQRRFNRREKQIRYAKDTQEYKRWHEHFVHFGYTPGDPKTPRVAVQNTKKAFEEEYLAWRARFCNELPPPRR